MEKEKKNEKDSIKNDKDLESCAGNLKKVEEFPAEQPGFFKIHKKCFIIIAAIILVNIYAFIFSASILLYINYRTSMDYIDEKENDLYQDYKYPQISILCPISGDTIMNREIESFISSMEKQSLADIEVILLIKGENSKLQNDLSQAIHNDSRFNIIHSYDKKETEIWNLIHNIYKVKGRFITMLDISETLEKNELERIWNYSNGKIDNYFLFKDSTGKEKELLRKSILLKIFDEHDTELTLFNSYSDIIKFVKDTPLPTLNYMNIGYATDNKFIPLAYVSAFSMLDKRNFNTFYQIFVVLNKDVTEDYIKMLYSLYEQFDYFNITAFYLKRKIEGVFNNTRLTISAFYRFAFPSEVPQIDKILYIDSDTLVYQDLYNLYNLNFNGKLMLGLHSNVPKYYVNGTCYYYLQNGILLMNLKLMRKVNFENIFFEASVNYTLERKDLYYNTMAMDQYILRDFFGDQVYYFPAIYHTRTGPLTKYGNISLNIETAPLKKRGIYKGTYNEYDVLFGDRYPTIRHYIKAPKPIEPNGIIVKKDDWWYFARKTKYYTFLKEIRNKY